MLQCNITENYEAISGGGATGVCAAYIQSAGRPLPVGCGQCLDGSTCELKKIDEGEHPDGRNRGA